MAGLHGRLRSAGPRNRAGAGARAAARWASPSACCARRSAPAIRRGAWATTWPSRSWPSQHRDAARRPRWARWFRSARIACAPSATDWREYGATFEIEHHSELLARLAGQAARRRSGPRETVVFHDPCYLGRYRNVYDEPRAVIAGLSATVVEPAAVARALVLLRRGRRPDVPGRGKRQARERGRARKNWWRPARRPSARRARSARRCSATRLGAMSGSSQAHRQSCWTSRRLVAAADCRRNGSDNGLRDAIIFSWRRAKSASRSPSTLQDRARSSIGRATDS